MSGGVFRGQGGPLHGGPAQGAPAASGAFSSAGAILLRRFKALGSLSPAEADLLLGVAASPRQHPVRTEICAAGSACPPRFVVSGWVCRQRILADGRRQIVSFVLPGDPIGPLLRPRIASPCSATALTQVETVDGTVLTDAANEPGESRQGITRAVHLMDRLGEVLLRDQIVRLGRQTAYERVLHLLLEFRDRLLLVGLGQRDRFAMPLTQETLADALGLSVVHVNRTLQQIRRDGLIELRSGGVVLHDLENIEAMADWQPLPDAAE